MFRDIFKNRLNLAILTNIQTYMSWSVKYNILAKVLFNYQLLSEDFLPAKSSLQRILQYYRL